MTSGELEQLCERIKGGDRFALSRAITLVESTLPSDRSLAEALLAKCSNQSSGTVRVAVSGPPGVGKSTFIEALGLMLVQRGHRVAVLAVDPSSERTQGSILGDKTRMARLSRHPLAYIRPSPNTGAAGAIHPSSYETVQLCETAGYDVLLIETVGVGQAETRARHLSDIFVLLVQPASGDELQGMKKGILEVSDMVIVHKADGILADEAEKTFRTLKRLSPGEDTGRQQVFLCSSQVPFGHTEIWTAIQQLRSQDDFRESRTAAQAYWFEQRVRSLLLEEMMRKVAPEMDALRQDISTGKRDYLTATRQILARFHPPDKGSD